MRLPVFSDASSGEKVAINPKYVKTVHPHALGHAIIVMDDGALIEVTSEFMRTVGELRAEDHVLTHGGVRDIWKGVVGMETGKGYPDEAP